MGRAYSQDLRDRVIDAVIVEGMSRHGAAHRFGISPASAIKWVQQFEREGRRTKRSGRGQRPSPVRQHREWLLDLVKREFSLTLQAMCDRLREVHDVRADPGILSRFFRAEGISIKKNYSAKRAAAARRCAQARTLEALSGPN